MALYKAVSDRRYRRNRCVPFYRQPIRIVSIAPWAGNPKNSGGDSAGVYGNLIIRQRRAIDREHSARDFSSRRDSGSAGILCVFQAFQTAGLAEKIRRSAQTQLCGGACAFVGSAWFAPPVFFLTGSLAVLPCKQSGQRKCCRQEKKIFYRQFCRMQRISCACSHSSCAMRSSMHRCVPAFSASAA